MNDKFVSWEDAVSWLVGQPDKQELVKDCYYDKSVLEAAQRYWKSAEWAAIKLELPDNRGNVLDLGAGRGIASYALAKEGWNVVAVEPDSSNLVGAGAIEFLAKSENLNINVLKEFGEKIQCDSDSFDVIFARQVLHHARDLNQLCSEVFRLLKSGGSFIGIRDHVISSSADLPTFLELHPLHNLYGGENAYTTSQYLAAMKQAGFKIKKVIRSFDSVINYAPYTRNSLREELKLRFRKLPLGFLVVNLLDIELIMDITLALLSHTDRRPGRLYSFVCTKPKS